jgi:hypothetical protein
MRNHKMKTRIRVLGLALTLFIAVAGLVSADTNDIGRPRWVLSGGASDAAVGVVTLRATLGQPVVGPASSDGGGTTVGQGFWHGPILGGYAVYLPVVLR